MPSRDYRKSFDKIYTGLLYRLENLKNHQLLSESTYSRQQEEISQFLSHNEKSTSSNNNEIVKPFPFGLLYFFQLSLYQQKLESKIKVFEKKINKIANQFDVEQITDKESKQTLIELVNTKKSLVNLNTILLQQLPNLPYSPERSSKDFKALIDVLEPLSTSRTEELEKFLVKHYLENERDKPKLNQILSSLPEHDFFSSKEFKKFTKSFQKLLAKQLTHSAIQSSELTPEFEERIIPRFEQYFKGFMRDKYYSFDTSITWPETLTEKNSKNYVIEKNQLKHQPESSLELEFKQSSLTTSDSPELLVQKNEIETNLWELVGKIIINYDGRGIGVADFPVVWKDKIYLPTNIEKDLPPDYTDALFRESQSLRILGISDSTEARRNLLKEEIANTLDIPLELALIPTLVREYLGKRNIEVDLVFKNQLIRKEYYLIQDLDWNPASKQIYLKKGNKPVYDLASSDRSLQIQSSPSISKRLYSSLQSSQIKISLWDTTVIGSVLTEIRLSTIGYHLIIELYFPSENFLSSLIPKIKSYDLTSQGNILWQLRFQISKKIDVFEGESLLPHNLWRFINSEKIPILPFDVRTSYIAIVPSGGLNVKSSSSDELRLNRGIEPTPLYDYILKSKNYNVLSKNHPGSVIGISLNESSMVPELVYCPISAEEILKRVKREVISEKRKKRIQKALRVPLAEALHPRNLIVYLLFYSVQFNVLIDFYDYHAVNEWLFTTFDLQSIPLSMIANIDHEKQEIHLNS